MHTSTVTVVVLPWSPAAPLRLRESDLVIRTTRDTGPGGQHRNKTDSCVVITHIPTGLTAKASDRSQQRNRIVARQMIEARVAAHQAAQAAMAQSIARRSKHGSGMRGDKVRTYRLQDGTVTDHRTGRKRPWEPIQKGQIEDLW